MGGDGFRHYGYRQQLEHEAPFVAADRPRHHQDGQDDQR